MRAPTTVAISPLNITPGKASTEFAVFVQPYGTATSSPGSSAWKRTASGCRSSPAAVTARSWPDSRPNQAVAFFETGKAGTVTILVAGKGLSTGAYTVETTLPGDVNGDGQVNLADEQAFAKTYVESRGDKDYKASADYNQNGIVNLYDALAMERNMTPLTQRRGRMGRDQPGTFRRPALPRAQEFGRRHRREGCHYQRLHNAREYRAGGLEPGRLHVRQSGRRHRRPGLLHRPGDEHQGVNTYNFKILDPFGHQYIRSFPVYWTVYAESGSPYKFKPSKNPYRDKKI